MEGSWSEEVLEVRKERRKSRWWSSKGLGRMGVSGSGQVTMNLIWFGVLSHTSGWLS